MKYFVAIDENLLLQLWLKAPDMVAPFNRPFCPHDLMVPDPEQEVRQLLPNPAENPSVTKG